VKKKSRLRSRDPGASGVKCGLHGGKNSKMKVEPQNQGRAGTMWEPSHECDWRSLHRVRGVSSGSLENHWVPWLIHKAKTEEPKTEEQQHRTGLIGGYQSDQ
jgi:hypothetical protein